MNIYKKTSLIAMIMASFVYLAACGSSGGSKAASSSSSTSSTPAPAETCTKDSNSAYCVPAHTGTVLWTTAHYGGESYGGGEAYGFDLTGMPTPTKGKLSFKISGLDDGELPTDMLFLVFAKMFADSIHEANYHFALWREGAIQSRLITQTFDCGGNGIFCTESQERVTSASWDGSKTYKFEFEWDDSAVHLLVTEVASGAVNYDATQPTHASYQSADYIQVGNGAFPPYARLHTSGYLVLSELRLSIVQ